MAYPVTLNGRTYTLADFEGQNYVDGLPDAFEDFVTHAGNLYSTTSTTSNSIGTGSKTFTVESSKPYQVGTPLRITDSAAPSTNWIDAIVTAYSGTTLTVDAVAYAGSGTKTSWNINIGGGGTSYTGTLPVAQGGTGATTAAAARTNLDTYSKSEADSRFLNVAGEASNVNITGNLNVGDATATHIIQAYDNSGSTPISFGLGEQPNTGRALRIEKVDETDDDPYASNFYFGDHPTAETGSFNLYASQEQNKIFRVNSAGDVTFYDGGVASFEFDASADLIINQPGNDRDFRIESSGSANMFFVDGGSNKIGINTSSPSSTLTVNSTGANISTLIGTNTGIAYLDLTNSAATAINNGVGLELRANSSTTERQMSFIISRWTDNTDATRTADFRILNQFEGTSDTWLSLQPSSLKFNSENRDRDFQVGSTSTDNMLYVDASSDRVGVGLAAPQTVLHVHDNTPILRLQDSNNGTGGTAYRPYIDFWASDAKVGSAGFSQNKHFDIVVENTNSAGFRLFSGNPIVMNENGTAGGDFRVESDSNAYGIYLDSGDNVLHFMGSTFGAANTSTGCYITNSGQFIAKSTGSHYFNRTASNGSVITFYRGTALAGSISLDSTSGTTYNTTSDRRLKTDIQAIDDATDRLMAMNPVSHKWIAEPDADAVVGFIAQEMKEIIPEAVEGDPDGDEMMSMDYGRITPIIVAALQEANKEIAELKTRIAALEGK